MALKGKSFTFGSKGSTSGRLMPEHFIRVNTKMSPKESFGAEMNFSGAHDKTAQLVQAVVYAYRRFVKLESEDAESQATGAPRASEPKEPTEIPEDLLPQRPRVQFDPNADVDPDDPEARQMLEYNDYLAQLARRSDRSAQ